MTLLVILLSVVALSLERICYIFAWRNPEVFRAASVRLRIADDGVGALERCFYVFKAIQAAVFLLWWLHFSRERPLALSPSPAALAGGVALVVFGQILNFSAMYRLGRIGTFYGIRFGHSVARCHKFPYSVFNHPQYLGTVATIWGLFLAIRFPNPDWAGLPSIETIYYLLGAVLESDRVVAAAESRAVR